MEKPRYQEAVKPIGSGAPTLYVLFFPIPVLVLALKGIW